MLSGNKGRLLRASNSMNTLKRRLGGRPQYTTATEPHARRRWRPGAPAAARRGADHPVGGAIWPASTNPCYCPCLAVHRFHTVTTHDRRRPDRRDAPGVRVLSSEFRAFEWVTAGGA